MESPQFSPTRVSLFAILFVDLPKLLSDRKFPGLLKKL